MCVLQETLVSLLKTLTTTHFPATLILVAMIRLAQPFQVLQFFMTEAHLLTHIFHRLQHLVIRLSALLIQTAQLEQLRQAAARRRTTYPQTIA